MIKLDCVKKDISSRKLITKYVDKISNYVSLNRQLELQRQLRQVVKNTVYQIVWVNGDFVTGISHYD